MPLDQETLKKILKKHHEEQARDEKGRFACKIQGLDTAHVVSSKEAYREAWSHDAKILGLDTIPKPFAIEGLPEDYK